MMLLVVGFFFWILPAELGMPLALGPAFIYQKDLLLHHRSRLQQMNNILHLLGDIIVQQKQLLLQPPRAQWRQERHDARRAIQSKRLKPSVSLAEACLQRYIVRSFVPSPAALLMVATGCFSDNHNCCTAKSTLGMVMSNIIQAKNLVMYIQCMMHMLLQFWMYLYFTLCIGTDRGS